MEENKPSSQDLYPIYFMDYSATAFATTSKAVVAASDEKQAQSLLEATLRGDNTVAKRNKRPLEIITCTDTGYNADKEGVILH